MLSHVVDVDPGGMRCGMQSIRHASVPVFEQDADRRAGQPRPAALVMDALVQALRDLARSNEIGEGD